MSSITKIVLTGGPCAGKTTALSKIIEKFSDLGYLVLALPEAATLFSQSGVNFLTDNRDAAPDRITIHKRRKCFVWQNQYFEVDTFLNPALPYALLEIEGVKEHEEINFPPFIRIIEDVTDNKAFYNKNLSKRK